MFLHMLEPLDMLLHELEVPLPVLEAFGWLEEVGWLDVVVSHVGDVATCTRDVSIGVGYVGKPLEELSY